MHSQCQAPTTIDSISDVPSAISGQGTLSKMDAEVRPLRRVFRGETSQVPLVRDFIRRYLDGWACPGAAVQDILLCATELAANAVRHSRSGLPGGQLVVQIVLQPGKWVEVAVEDAGGQWAKYDACDDDEYGRGLQIVAALSVDTGIVTGGHGRTAWFRCPWNPHEGS